MKGRTPALAMLLMVVVTAVWGLTFVTVKEAIAVYPPTSFLAVRFGLAALVLVGFALRRPRDAGLGLVIGALLAAGYLTQTYGLTAVPASTAGLLTGLFVVFTPLCDALFFRLRAAPVTWLAVLGALAGMVLLASGGSTAGAALVGEGLLLLCALAFAAHISFLSRFSARHSPVSLAAWQMVACAVLFSASAGATGRVTAPPAAVVPALVFTGVVASAVAFLAQTYVQRHLSAPRTALLLTAEPAFALLFGITLAHDPVNPLRLAGAAMILLVLVAHEAVVARGRPEGEPAI